MASIAVVLEGLSIALTISGLTLATVRRLRAYIHQNQVIQDHIWDSSEAKPDPPTRLVALSGWVNDETVQQESPSIRAAYDCFDGIFNFLRAGQNTEKAHFSSHMLIIGRNNSLRTEAGCSLTLSSEDEGSEAFNKVTDFIYGVLDASETQENFYQTETTVLVLDANVMDDPRSLRSTEDTSEIVSMTAIALELLKEVGNVISDGQFVKVVPGERPEPLYKTASMAYITARWPGTLTGAPKVFHGVSRALKDLETNIEQLIEDVAKCSMQDGVRNIILLGRTGSGKSHTGNWILSQLAPNCQDRFDESSSGSMTNHVEYLPRGNTTANQSQVPSEAHNRKVEVRIWDTPGLDDGYNRDLQHIDRIESATLEMGAISAVIMCFERLERIDGSTTALIRKYSRIIGRSLAERLLVVVNRQAGEVIEDQKKAVQVAFHKHGSLSVGLDQIHDLGQHTLSLSLNQMNVFTQLMRFCKQDSVKVGYFERLSCGLLELEKLGDDDEKEEAKELLLYLSSNALKKRLLSARGPLPLVEKANDGSRFILGSDVVFKDQNKREYLEEHILDLPSSVKGKIGGRLSVFVRGLNPRHGTVSAVVKRVRQMRLVYPALPESIKFSDRKGIVAAVRKIHYRLLSVDEALEKNVRDLLHHALGRDDVARDVTPFKIISRKESNRVRPQRR